MKRNVPVTETPVASPAVTFDINDPVLQKIIADAVAARMAVEQASKADKPSKTDQSAQNAWLAQKIFTKKGYKDVQPGITILTYNKWIEAGFRVKPGEHALRVNNLRLFHKTQVEPMNPVEKKAAIAKLHEKAAKRSATVSPISPSAAKLPPVTLVAAEPAKAPKARKAKVTPTDQPTA